MRTLGELLGSRDRIEVLRVLMAQPHPVGLRYLARIADIYPHSAEVALKGLLADRLVAARRKSTGALYEIHRTHPDVAILASVFLAASRADIEAKNRLLNKRALLIMPFIRQAVSMLSNAQRGSHREA